MDLKELNHAGEHGVFGSITVTGDIDSKNLKTVRRDVNLIQNNQVKLNTKIDNYWDSLSDDGILTPLEKISLRKEWEGITQSYAALYDLASEKQLLNTPYWVDYDEAFFTLKNYLFTQEAIFDNMESTTVLNDKDEFDQYFSEYYHSQQFVNLAITTGLIDKLGLRALTSLEEEGTNGELAFYRGELYQYDENMWVKIGTSEYLGVITNTADISDTLQDGQYLMAGGDLVFSDILYVNGEELLVNGETLLIQYLHIEELGTILYWEDGLWHVADEDDPRYIAVLADYFTVTGQMPAIFVSAIQEIAETVIPPEPRYLGVSTTAPVNKNKGDYFLYSGINVGDWVKSRIYRWSGTEWVMMDPEDETESDYYMRALQDILTLEAAGDGYFSNLFCNAFFTNKASINALKVHTIYLYDTGAIQSQNSTYVSETTGLRIDATGNVDANGTMHIKGPCAIGHSISGIGNYNLYIDGNTYIGGNAKVKADLEAKTFSTPNYSETSRTGVYIDSSSIGGYNYPLKAAMMVARQIRGWGGSLLLENAYVPVLGCDPTLCTTTASIKSRCNQYNLLGNWVHATGFLRFNATRYNVSRVRYEDNTSPKKLYYITVDGTLDSSAVGDITEVHVYI
ncbi:MAG: hypothetical protein J6S67_12325 [Methanobrevibacter sp.]|nr:hypothetical protein [Methanobrevibacter sp.]